MVHTPTTLIAFLLAAALRWYPKHEFFWERPTVSVGKGGSIVGRRTQFTVGNDQYDQETYLGKFVVETPSCLRCTESSDTFYCAPTCRHTICHSAVR